MPYTLPSFTNPTSSDDLDTAGVEHDIQHAEVNDAVELLAAKVGEDGSADTASIDAKVRSHHTDYTIYKDGSSFYARHERDASQPFTGSALNTVANAVFDDLTSFAGAADTEDTGGIIRLATPTGGSSHEVALTAPLTPGPQQKIIGPAEALKIKASGAGWASGTIAAPKALLDCGHASRLYVSGLYLDCDQISGTTGIFYRKAEAAGPDAGDTRDLWNVLGGNDANSYFYDIVVKGHSRAGLQVGIPDDSYSTSTMWMSRVQILDDKAADNGIGLAIYQGDTHVGDLCNVRVSNPTGYCVYVEGGATMIKGNSHFVNNHDTNQNGCINVAKGAETQILGAYLDNLNTGPAVLVSASAGSAPRGLIMGCRVNGASGLVSGADNVVSAFVFDGTTNRCPGWVIMGNQGSGKGSDGTAGKERLKAILENIGTGGDDPGLNQVFLGNVFRWTLAYYAGSRPSTAGFNTIEQPTSTYHEMRSAVFQKAGAISDSDFLQPSDGMQGYDTTNHQHYMRDGGAWKKSAAYT